MSKLVRDGVKAFLDGKGAHIEFSEAREEQREALVFAKLLEEAGEWLGADGRAERLKELGDLMEVVWALGEVDEIGATEILQQAHGKRRERGGFDDLSVMSVELGEDAAARKRGASEVSQRSTTGVGLGDGRWYSG